MVVGEPKANLLAKELLVSARVKLDEDGKITELAGMENDEQGFVIRFAKHNGRNCVALAGNTPQGTFYAVQTFGDRVYRRDDGAFCADSENVLTAPAIKYRSLAGNLGGPDWLGSLEFEQSFVKSNGAIDVEAFIDWVARYKVNNLNIWMFDLMWGLPYPSGKYPEAVNKYHPNVKSEFFGELLEYARKNYIDVWLLLDFPDCWLGVLHAYPELAPDGFDESSASFALLSSPLAEYKHAKQ